MSDARRPTRVGQAVGVEVPDASVVSPLSVGSVEIPRAVSASARAASAVSRTWVMSGRVDSGASATTVATAVSASVEAVPAARSVSLMLVEVATRAAIRFT